MHVQLYLQLQGLNRQTVWLQVQTTFCLHFCVPLWSCWLAQEAHAKNAHAHFNELLTHNNQHALAKYKAERAFDNCHAFQHVAAWIPQDNADKALSHLI